MYADRSSGRFHWPEAEPYDAHLAGAAELDRLTHLVLVDGRLVDVWSEPVSGSRWQPHADRFDRERRPSVLSAPPPPLSCAAWSEWFSSRSDGG